MAATLQQEGSNLFIYVKPSGGSYVQVGCANSISVNLSKEVKEYMCDSLGLVKNFIDSIRDSQITVGGMYFLYTSGDDTSNYSVKEWHTAWKTPGTTLTIAIGSASTGVEALVATVIVKSIKMDHKTGDPSTYSIDLQCNDDADFETLA